MKKNILTFFALMFVACLSQAQDFKDKNILQVDLENGTINGLKPSASKEEVKKEMPQFTEETEENKGINCDGGLSYAQNDVFFYTARDYVVIRSAFNGKMSQELLNRNIVQVTKFLGKPEHTISPSGDEASIVVVYYKTSYGCLRVNYMLSPGFIFEIALHAKPINEAMLDLCF
jgi:hypothetical protein